MRYFLIALLLLAGCSTTTGYSEKKDYDSRVTIHVGSGGYAIVEIPLNVTADRDSTTSTDSKQDNKPATRLALSQAEGASTAASKLGEGLQALRDLKNIKDDRVDNKKTNSDNTSIAPPASNTDPISIEEYTKFTDLRPENGRVFRWMGKTGADYIGPLTFVFPECGYTFVVDNPAQDLNPEASRPVDQGVWFAAPEHDEGGCQMPGCVASVFSTESCKDATYVLMKTGRDLW